MKFKFFVLILFLFIPFIAQTEVGIFVKIAIDNTRYSSLLIHKPDNLDEKYKFIARRIKENLFDVNNLPKEFYKIDTHSGLTYMKTPIKIYEITPLYADRFMHILWTVDDFIIRREVYNIHKKLMFAYGYVDGLPEIMLMDKKKKYGDLENYLKEHFNLMKYNYKGFKIMSGKKQENGIRHILFIDGLNKFSVFIQKDSKKVNSNDNLTQILMGNNIFRKKINNELFTVVGTIPYKDMTTVINFVENKKEDFLK